MNFTNIRFQHDCQPAQRFRTGVSLHGHTLHSRESLDFIYRLAKNIPPIRIALNAGEARYYRAHGTKLDLARAWWTPPTAPRDAWTLEARRIETELGLDPLVSLSDHDDIEAGLTLRVLYECRDTPISVEWTVPYGPSFFHLGVHNIPPESARQTMADLAAFTAKPPEPRLGELLERLAANPETLIVFNHPYWDEFGIGQAAHRELAAKFAAAYLPFLHAFELNGLRQWKENRAVFELAERFQKPLISGGDRHALEPNTILNLTNSRNFSEFVREIREGYSDIFITRQYMEPFAMRILQQLEDILSFQENHALGWRRWCDRTFYRFDDGVVRSLGESWGEGEPLAVTIFVRALDILRHPHFKNAFRMAFARREEVVL